ncbi:hypothetical protein Nepgr_032240 [Nepenthes gracilis]|uniref:Transmembrane protein n=1 Tax=Nepenthes gracilis TaxID=150966 RepID=A0AAD3TJ35_NEPGR|nr:hypothetical protein Nepgr_032240 [Nepenthes gracilis]
MKEELWQLTVFSLWELLLVDCGLNVTALLLRSWFPFLDEDFCWSGFGNGKLSLLLTVSSLLLVFSSVGWWQSGSCCNRQIWLFSDMLCLLKIRRLVLLDVAIQIMALVAVAEL